MVASSYFVDAINGSDSNNGTTWALALVTRNGACQKTSAVTAMQITTASFMTPD